MENASIPIIGEGNAEPNDTYVEQLVASAKAAIDEGVRLGVVDRNRVAVMGHSYGAFMTVNLLAHTDFFKAGIARSGAYNRTLTPFGFQNEDRTYWQAPGVYNAMSPFMHADQIKTPLLLIHGEADNNSGTFPIQSERLFAALKGQGATVRFVLLPLEAHGYAARESILDMFWEMNTWMDTYVKNWKPRDEISFSRRTTKKRPTTRLFSRSAFCKASAAFVKAQPRPPTPQARGRRSCFARTRSQPTAVASLPSPPAGKFSEIGSVAPKIAKHVALLHRANPIAQRRRLLKLEILRRRPHLAFERRNRPPKAAPCSEYPQPPERRPVPASNPR